MDVQKKIFVHESAIIAADCSIGTGTKIWQFAHVMSSVTIGNNCILGQNVSLGPKVEIGNGVKIQNNVSLFTGVHCEDDVFLGPSCVFTNVINPRSALERKNKFQNTYVKRGASIGANATIICGNTIGSYALVGAGSVVTKDVKPFAMVVGNPARQIGWVSIYGHRLDFNQNNMALCKESKVVYTLKNKQVSILERDVIDAV